MIGIAAAMDAGAPSRSSQGLPQIHRETFRLVFNDRLTLDQAVLWLRQDRPGIERQHVEDAHAELSRRLTARQRRELSERDSERAPPAPLEAAPELETPPPIRRNSRCIDSCASGCITK